MRRCMVLRDDKGGVVGKLKDLTSGNWVNPRATDPMQEADFRVPAPASQPNYINDLTAPNKTHDIATIAYHPRAGRVFVEPQQLIAKLNSKGEVTLEVLKTVGTRDEPYTPVSTAAESEKKLKIDVADEMRAAFAEIDWTKPGGKMPSLAGPSYQWTEVDESKWGRKD